jgi:hypothetical protein
LHNDRGTPTTKRNGEEPGFVGRKTGKHRLEGIFENGRDRFGGKITGLSTEGNIATPQAGRGLPAVGGISQNCPAK